MKRMIACGTHAVAVLMSVCVINVASAAIVIDLDYEFSHATSPSGATPWAQVTLDQQGSGVRITLKAMLNGTSEKVTYWYLNFNPEKDLDLLSWMPVDVADATVTVSKGVNAFKADGDGSFDIEFAFAKNGPGTLQGEEQVQYDFAYSGGGQLLDSDFYFESFPGGGNGTWYTAAHVQGIGTDGSFSGWIGGGEPPSPGPTVPEPSALAIWGLGVLGLGLYRRYRS